MRSMFNVRSARAHIPHILSRALPCTPDAASPPSSVPHFALHHMPSFFTLGSVRQRSTSR
eukprot:scaffold27116_cov51-Phaeocystis_antarctica.AAC.2